VHIILSVRILEDEQNCTGGRDMTDVPGPDEMTAVLRKTIDLAGERLGADEVAGLAQVMGSLCLQLKDLDTCYFVTFDESGSAGFSLEDPGAPPMLTISTTSEVFHKMALGESNTALEFAMRKVKMTGVPLPRLAKVGGTLIDTLFQCYDSAVQVQD
jgi:hypothetical protein